MVYEIWLIAGSVGIIAILGAIGALLWREQFQLRWFALALALYIFYEILLTNGLYNFPILLPDAAWNWQGKALAIFGMLAVAASPKFGFLSVGLTPRQGPNYKPAMWLFLTMSAIIFYFAIIMGDGADDLETILFQWTAPGLDEELFYRGVLLLAMNEAFRARLSILGAPMGYGGLLTCVLFGFAHALDYGAGGYSFDMITFILTGVPSFILLWLRERTGSLLLPILAHNIANGAFTLF